jgi:hypothetical protein
MLRACLKAMTGKHTPAMIHGTVESILLALANSSAPALYGFRKSDAAGGAAGVPGWRVVADPSGVAICRSDGDR